MDSEIDANPNGLIQCLKMLAEEAACLSLTRTFAALQDALAICRAETEMAPAAMGHAGLHGLVH